MSSDLYLMHHGIKGMRWGVRRYQDANGNLTDQGKRRYGIQDARKYYKINRLQRAKENTDNSAKKERLSKRIRRVQTRSDRKKADLSQEDINIGREIVAKNRLKLISAASVATAGATAAGISVLASNPKTRWAVPLAAVGGAAATAGVGRKVPYYYMENRRYKQVNPKDGTKRGQTSRQRKLKTAGKVLGGAAALAGAGALAYYTGKKVGFNRANADIYNRASEATKRIIDANAAYSRGKKARQVSNQAAKYGAKQASKAYKFVTSPETKAAVRKTAKTVATKTKNFVTSPKTKAAVRRAGQKTVKGVKRAGRGAWNFYRGFSK